MKYKNITEKDLFVPQIGLVKAGEIVEVGEEINNKNFELVVVKKENAQDTKVETLKEDNKK